MGDIENSWYDDNSCENYCLLAIKVIAGGRQQYY